MSVGSLNLPLHMPKNIGPSLAPLLLRLSLGLTFVWAGLGKIEAMMKQSIYDVTKRAFQQYPSDGTQRDEWLFNYAAQPILTIDMVYWTAGVSHAIMEIQSGRENDALKTFRNFSERQLKAMISLVRGNLDAL